MSAYFAKPTVKNTILPQQSRHSVWHVRGKNKKTKQRECQNLANPKDLKQHPETAESTRES